MCEAWEDILMEMDSKLMKFADEKQKVCGGSVSNDFLRLLMVGKPRYFYFRFVFLVLTSLKSGATYLVTIVFICL